MKQTIYHKITGYSFDDYTYVKTEDGKQAFYIVAGEIYSANMFSCNDIRGELKDVRAQLKSLNEELKIYDDFQKVIEGKKLIENKYFVRKNKWTDNYGLIQIRNYHLFVGFDFTKQCYSHKIVIKAADHPASDDILLENLFSFETKEEALEFIRIENEKNVLIQKEKREIEIVTRIKELEEERLKLK